LKVTVVLAIKELADSSPMVVTKTDLFLLGYDFMRFWVAGLGDETEGLIPR